MADFSQSTFDPELPRHLLPNSMGAEFSEEHWFSQQREEFSEENRLATDHIYSSDSARFSQARFEDQLRRPSPELPNSEREDFFEENRLSHHREEFSEETRLSHDHIHSNDSEWGIPDSQPPPSLAPSMVSGAATTQVQAPLPPAVGGRPSPAPRPPRPLVGPAVSEVRKLTRADFGRIVDWLEIPENYAMLHGTSSRLSIGERHPSKKTVFKLMLVTLHSKGFAPFVTTGDNLGKRVTRYNTKLKEALSLKNSSGWGLTINEQRCGITAEDKFEKIYPHFARMEALYGERSNVNPDALGSVGIRGCPEVYHEALPEDTIMGADTPVQEAGMDEGDASQAGEVTTEATTPADEDDLHPEETEENTANTGTGGRVKEGLQQTPVPPSAPSSNAPPSAPPSMPPRRQPIIRPASSNSQAASKSNVADIYLDKIAGKSEYRKQMIDTKDKWATLELADRREARQELAWQLKENARAQRKHEDKRAKREHTLALSVARTQQTTSILQVLIQSNKTREEIESLMTLLNR